MSEHQKSLIRWAVAGFIVGMIIGQILRGLRL